MSKSDLQTATLAGGCFWCLEAVFQRVHGIHGVVSGYAGGEAGLANYTQVSSGATAHAETVQMRFDPSEIRYEEILDIFWTIHDPTTPNRQGNDIGPQYRSVIFYENDEQKQLAEHSIATVAQKLWDQPIVTEVTQLDTFYPAEAEHQDYFNQHPEQAYCQVIINPKLHKLQQKFASKLKSEYR